MGTHQPADDAKRFQAWQLAVLNATPAGTELLSFGPFRAVGPIANQPGAWVTIVEGSVDKGATDKGVAALRAVFKRRNAMLEIEYNEALFPGVGPWLEALGLTLAERNLLMACRPDGFRPPATSDVILHRLTAQSDDADLQVFQTIRWTNGSDNEDAVPSVEQLRKELASTTSIYLLALLDGERAGTGVSHALEGAAEIVGVVTRADKRRRGVAAASQRSWCHGNSPRVGTSCSWTPRTRRPRESMRCSGSSGSEQTWFIATAPSLRPTGASGMRPPSHDSPSGRAPFFAPHNE